MSEILYIVIPCYNEDTMVSVSVIGTEGFFSLQQQVNRISNASPCRLLSQLILALAITTRKFTCVF